MRLRLIRRTRCRRECQYLFVEPGTVPVRRSELMAAVSLAADLGMGQPLESGLATCVVATNLALRLGLDIGLRQRIYDLSLLQHIGCTSVSAEMASILGDELVMSSNEN